MNKNSNQKGQLATVLTLLTAGLITAGALAGSFLVQKTTPQSQTLAKEPTPWKQCQKTNSSLPCGSCSIQLAQEKDLKGIAKFSCELNCGGSETKCPGKTAGTYNITHRWERCKKAGNGACGEWAKGDFIQVNGKGDLYGGPWEINGESLIEGIAGFPIPSCGRIQADVQMTAVGTNVAGVVYDTGKDCTVQDNGKLTPVPTFSIKPTGINPAPTSLVKTGTPGPVPGGCAEKNGECRVLCKYPQTIIRDVSCQKDGYPGLGPAELYACCTKDKTNTATTIKIGFFLPQDYTQTVTDLWTTGQMKTTDVSQIIDTLVDTKTIKMKTCNPSLPAGNPESCL